MPSFLYSCAGFRLSSTLPLPELALATDPADTRPIITVREAPVPELLADCASPEKRLQVAGDVAQLNVTGVGHYRVTAGSDVAIEPLPGASERNIRLFLLGSVLGLICHQRGILPLHANAVEVDGVAMAFAGDSGAGKSTLAAYFQARGYRVLCDDVCMVSFNDGEALAWPGLRRLRLWGDAAEAFGHTTATLERVTDFGQDGREKYLLELAPEESFTPIPLRRLYLLDRAAADAPPAIEPIHGAQAAGVAMSQTYRPQYVRLLGLREQHFTQVTTLLSSVELYRARRRWGHDVFADEAERLETHLKSR